MHPWWARRYEPVDNAGLVVFRAVFGTLMVCECTGALTTGWVTRALVEPRVEFPMVGFEWIPRARGVWAYSYYAVMAVLAAFMAVGAWFRVATATFGVLWSSSYVMQVAHYNNHYYLIALVSFLLLATPAAADFSVDARRDPSTRSFTCPRWCYEILMAQAACVYGFAAFAKLQPDWLSARPMEIGLAILARTRELGWPYTEPWLKWVLAWGGITFDALIVPALLWSRTRYVAVFAGIAFHTFNSITFRVGVFPYLGMAMMLPFFPADALRTWLPKSHELPVPAPPLLRTTWTPGRRVGAAAFAAYFTLQALLPLRHVVYPGRVDWHEEGYRMSWRMMLRAKSGRASFLVRDHHSSAEWEIDPRPLLTSHQAFKLPVNPDMIWLFAQHLKATFDRLGYPDVAVYADSRVRLNGRKRAPLIDPTVDLAATEWRFFGYNQWIVPYPE